MKKLEAHCRIKGHKPGMHCPMCSSLLLPVIAIEGSEGGIIGGRRARQLVTIDHLTCENCSAIYEVAPEFRGRDITTYLEDRLATHVRNPDMKPAECSCCLQKLTEGTKTADYTSGRRTGPVATVATYLYCNVCFKVLWVERTAPGARPHMNPP